MNQKNKFKKDQFEIRMRDEINQIIRTEISDVRLKLVSITRVEMSADYAYAKCYWDNFDDKVRGDVKKALEGISGKVRSSLSKRLDVRHTPTVTFLYDAQFNAESDISEILDEEVKKGRYQKGE